MCVQLLGLLLFTTVVQSSMKVPEVTFNNGRKIPILGFGTSRLQSAECIQAVKDAIDVGYRHFDCAYHYFNEKEIGQAIADKISEGVVKREDLFIVSKLWNTFHKPEAVERAFNISLNDLGLQYIDLYLMHFPCAETEMGEQADDDYLDTWLAMEKLYFKGLARSIGVSNFNKRQIQRLLTEATVVPVTNQVECHPRLNQKKLIEFCKSNNITVTSHQSLGSKTNTSELLENPKIKRIAAKFQKTSAQVVLRYQVQRDVIVIPKTSKKHRMIENSQLFDFELSDYDMAEINSMDVHGRLSLWTPSINHKCYPFNDEY